MRTPTEIVKHGWTKAKTEVLSKFDSWTNSMTGFGTSRDKTTFTRIGGYHRLTDPELSNLYHGDDTAAKIVDLLPQEMMREPFEVDLADHDLNAKVADKLDALCAREHLLGGLRWGRLYGGAAILLGCDDGLPASEPLVPERAKDVSYLFTVDRRYLWPVSFYATPGDPKFGQVERYQVTVQGFTSDSVVIVHESRLILFGGASTGSQERRVNYGWDHSVLVKVYDVLAAYNDVWQAIRILATDANQAVFSIAGLAEAISGGAKEALESRLRLTDMSRSMLRAVVVDAGDDVTKPESFQRQSVSFADIPNLLDRWGVRISAAAETPVTLFMGQSPAGLNATGESDFRGFYDRVRSKQHNDLGPKIRRLVEVFLRTKAGGSHKLDENGKLDTTIKVTFEPLWTEAPSVEAKRRLDIANADKTYVDAGVVLPEEVALTRFQEDGSFNDGAIQVDRPTRETVLKEELLKLKEPEPEPVPPPPIPPPTPAAPPPIPEPDDEAA
jgi:phage-related protein (TIGR01555 family)